MKDFLFLFRSNSQSVPQQSPEQMQAITQKWMDWVSGLASAGHLVDRGNRLEKAGKVLRPGGLITDGPYMELKEAIGGYTMVRAEDLEAAADLAKGCPALEMGGNVEVRAVDAMLK